MGNLTSREQFLNEKKSIQQANEDAVSLETEADEALDEIEEQEKEIDKSLGDKKVVVTRAQYDTYKAKQNEALAIQAMTGLKAMKAKPIDKKKQELIAKIAKNFLESKNVSPILEHLFKKKIKVAERTAVAQARFKELNIKLLTEMTEVSNEMVRCNSTAEELDNDIIEQYDIENKDALEQPKEENEDSKVKSC